MPFESHHEGTSEMPTNLKPNHRLRYEREQRGWSQARVAEQIGTEAVNVSRWERGFSSPSPYYREKLCNLFEKNAQDLGFLVPGDHTEEREPAEDQPQPVSQSEQQNTRIPPSPSREARILAALSYLFWWMSGLPVLLLGSQDDFVLFHSLQSVLFFGLVSFLETVCIWLMDLPLSDGALLPFVLFFIVLNLVALPAWIVGIVKAFKGSYCKLPFVGTVSEKLAATMRQRTGASSNS
jgi:uncharacterized membrane protein/DNA-binding transcriptional regulator YiaG